MLRAILFDMGGTLDGDGHHWLDRFIRLYADHGLAYPREAIRAGFDDAERHAATDRDVMRAGFDALVRMHLDWQFEVHGLRDDGLRERMVRAFVTPVLEAGRRNLRLLQQLKMSGFTLGVVSNACGNAQALCDDLGYGPYLSVVVDSRLVGRSKPDPAIYEVALARLGLAPAEVLMVGDSYERDVVPAHAVGMRTAWLVPAAERREQGVADVCIDTLAALVPYVIPQERATA
jgi:putative hydrolase of the HAD superfamily